MTPHRFELRVYFEDTDAAGIVYHARYLAFAERARTEAMRALGVPHEEMARLEGLIFVVRRAEIDYLRPARLDDVLTIDTHPAQLRAATARLRQDVSARGREVARLEIELACVRMADGRPARIPPRWRAALEEVRSGSDG